MTGSALGSHGPLASSHPHRASGAGTVPPASCSRLARPHPRRPVSSPPQQPTPAQLCFAPSPFVPFGDSPIHCTDWRDSLHPCLRDAKSGSQALRLQARRDHRDAWTSAQPRAVPEVPAGGGGASGAWAAAGSASAAAAEGGRVGRGLEQLRCSPAPPAAPPLRR